MKRIAHLLFIVVITLSTFSAGEAQNGQPKLAKVAKALDCLQKHIGTVWKREGVKPITGSEDVLIYMYVSAGRRVKVSILYYASESDAIKACQTFASGTRTRKIPNLGDEAYAWGHADQIAVRKSNLTVFVSAISDIDSLLPALDQSERDNLGLAEQVALNKNFARMIVNVLSDLDGACQPMERF